MAVLPSGAVCPSGRTAAVSRYEYGVGAFCGSLVSVTCSVTVSGSGGQCDGSHDDATVATWLASVSDVAAPGAVPGTNVERGPVPSQLVRTTSVLPLVYTTMWASTMRSPVLVRLPVGSNHLNRSTTVPLPDEQPASFVCDTPLS